jgi:hypothetical protein
MQVAVSISPATVELGSPVTVSFTSSQCADVTLTIDNFPNPISLGRGDISGSIKVLPLTDGTFNVTITGSGKLDNANDYMPVVSQVASCNVT